MVVPENTPEIDGGADRTLPETAGYSAAELLLGLSSLLLGGSILFFGLRRNSANTTGL